MGRPRATARAVWFAPTRMRVKLQATIHSPEWIYARPLSDVAQIHPQELIFWGVKHVEALSDRCQGSDDTSNELPHLRALLRLSAMHVQDPPARLAAAEAMSRLHFDDPAIYAEALKLHLAHLARQLDSTDAAIRCAAAKGLGCVGAPAVGHADALALRCQDSERCVRVAAATALGGIGPAAAAHTRVLAEMLTDSSDEARLAAAQALGLMGEAAFEQSKTLEGKLQKGHPFLGIAAAWTFGQMFQAKSDSAV